MWKEWFGGRGCGGMKKDSRENNEKFTTIFSVEPEPTINTATPSPFIPSTIDPHHHPTLPLPTNAPFKDQQDAEGGVLESV